MRDRVERFVVLPFSVGCISESSVAVAALTDNHKRWSKPNSNASLSEIREDEEESMKNMFKYLALSKPEISTGFHRLFRSFKTFSQLFGYKDEEMEEEIESDMEIGFPTDVKHVSHIGWEGPVTTKPAEKGWEELMPPELLALDPLKLHQPDELISMSTQPSVHSSQLVNASTT